MRRVGHGVHTTVAGRGCLAAHGSGAVAPASGYMGLRWMARAVAVLHERNMTTISGRSSGAVGGHGFPPKLAEAAHGPGVGHPRRGVCMPRRAGWISKEARDFSETCANPFHGGAGGSVILGGSVESAPIAYFFAVPVSACFLFHGSFSPCVVVARSLHHVPLRGFSISTARRQSRSENIFHFHVDAKR